MLTKVAHCLCGAVAFEADMEDGRYGVCHCGMCRRWVGGPNFAKEVTALRITQGADRVVPYRSSDWAERSHCAVCGSALWYRLIPSDTYIPSVGVFDDLSDMVLTTEVYVDHHPGGYAFAGDLKQMTEADVIEAHSGGGS